MTALPDVRAVMSKPSRMGTPLEISVPSVRVNRATAIFRSTMPTTGSFNRSLIDGHSSLRRPVPDFERDAGADEEHQNQESENAARRNCSADDDARRQRQVRAQADEQRGENRHDLPKQAE